VALQGTLETFALPDVLRLLASTKKTGALRVDTARGHGELMVRDGELVGGSAERSPRAETPPDVLFEMLRSNDGSFVFDSDAPVDSDGDAQDVESALSAAEAQLAEWTEIEAVVPSPHRLVTLRPHRDDDITFAPDQWSVVATVAGGCTVAQLADRLDATEMVATRAVRDLVEKGAVDLSDHDADSSPTSVSTTTEDRDDTPGEAPIAPAPMPSFENPPEAPSMPSFGSEPDSLLAEEPAPLPPLPSRQPLSDVASNGFAPPAEEATVASVAPLFGDPAPTEQAQADASPAGDEGSHWTPGNFGDDSSSFFDDDEEDPLADDPFGPDPFRIPRLPGQDEAGDDTEASEMARQLANLSPRAAQAVAAAAAATTDEERDEALAQATEGDDGVNRGLLLKFLSSVDE
jgi:hypothetical protein